MVEEREPLLPGSGSAPKKDTSRVFLACITLATVSMVAIGGAILLDGKANSAKQGPHRNFQRRAHRLGDPWDPCQGDLSGFPFCNTELSLDDRLDNLVSLIAQSEIGPQLTARQSPAIPRIGLPAYYWGTNAIHGVQNTDCLPDGKCPTSFPAPVSLAATFNSTHTAVMGRVIGTELRAYFNVHFHNSLDTWSPTINVARDPRWGRNVESFGEDPFVCGVHGSAYTRGAQFGQWTNEMPAKKPSVYMTAVTLKHWFAYSLEYYPVAPFPSRHNYSANVSEFDLVGTYMEAWDRVVRDSDPKGVMCSYNLVNGRSTCGTPEITAMLRQSLGFDGYITSDTDVISDMYTTQNIVHTPQQAVALGLKAGCDINSGGAYQKYLDSAISTGLVDAKFAQDALKRSYAIRFKLGLFDNKPNEWSNITEDVVGQPAFQQLSLDAARQGMVLLRNEGKVLPLSKGKTVALIGQNILSTNVLLGNYVGPTCVNGTSDCVKTLAEVITSVNGAAGHVITVKDITDVNLITTTVKQADHVIYFVDNALDGGREGLDRVTIGPSSAQRSAAQVILTAAGSKPVVLVLANGGHTSVDGWAEGFAGLLQAFMPGVHGAQAIAETIFGDNNPGGKLPVTMYKENFVNEADFTDMSMTSGSGRTYRYYKGTPSFWFGFGLSYTTFSLDLAPTNPLASVISLDDLKQPEAVAAHPGISRSLSLRNTGERAGDEVVFVYVVAHENVLAAMTQHRLLEAPEDVHSLLKRDVLPRRKLAGFQRVSVGAGAVVSVELTVALHEFALANANGVKAIYPGDYELVFTSGNGPELTVEVSITGETGPLVLSRLAKWW